MIIKEYKMIISEHTDLETDAETDNGGENTSAIEMPCISKQICPLIIFRITAMLPPTYVYMPVLPSLIKELIPPWSTCYVLFRLQFFSKKSLNISLRTSFI